MASKELRLGVPETFNGDKDEYHSWISSVQLYLLNNAAIYDTNEKQITFTLSFMKKGTAQGWAATFTADAIKLKKFGTFNDFVNLLETTFCTTDIKGKALGTLQTLNQDGDDILGYINQFKVAAHQSGLTDHSVLIHFLSKALNPGLMKQIYTMDTVPNKIEAWYTKAEAFQAQWLRDVGLTSGSDRPYLPTPKAKDPNAMDIDAVRIGKLTPKERKKCVEKGLCFCCQKAGHMSSSCPTFPSTPRTPYTCPARHPDQ
ncbi:hypothetical protein OG21DRAFT_1425826 [Imleria badia]|nr:hypothetical protein OG21DRAFT_1425826 [Imleria badia]